MSPRRVCVVGAGPAGLIVARELQRAGHRPVVVESAPIIGGKCVSVELDGHTDLCGHVGTPQYDRLADLLTEFGLATEPAVEPRMFDPDTGNAAEEPADFYRREVFQRYRALRAEQFPDITGPGLAHSARALAQPVTEWLAEHDLLDLGASLGANFTSAGYGHLDAELPALYFVKYVEMSGMLALGKRLLGHTRGFAIVGGYGALWNRVAAELDDVRTDTRITSIVRTDAEVVVRTACGTIVADDLILTVSLDQLAGVLDLREEEQDLAARVRHNDFAITYYGVSGLPRSGFYFRTDHAELAAKPGHMVAFHHRHPHTAVYACYSYGDDGTDDVAIASRVRADIARIGGRAGGLLAHQRWKYVPHFDSADLRAGVYDRIEQAQGRFRTYHAGSLPAFEMIESVIAYSQQLVRRHFPGRALTDRLAAPVSVSSAPSTTVSRPVSAEEIARLLISRLAAQAGVAPSVIDSAAPLEPGLVDSVFIATLQADLSELLDFPVPQTLLAEAASIDAAAAQLARLGTLRTLTGNTGILNPGCLLALTPARPFFCMGGITGTPHYLRALAEAIGAPQPFYGLLAPGYGADDEPLDDVVDLAAHYLDAIRHVQPHGPYLLGGHSFGGLVAYEMGAQLQRRGERAHIVMFDTYVPTPGQAPPPTDEQAAVEELLAIYRHSYGGASGPADAAHQAGRYERLARGFGAPESASVADYLAKLLTVYQASLTATAGYRPPPSSLPITLIKAVRGFPPVQRADRQVALELGHPSNGWDSTRFPGLRSVDIDANHFDMMSCPAVTVMADVVREDLRLAVSRG